jgi:hypothetical protein
MALILLRLVPPPLPSTLTQHHFTCLLPAKSSSRNFTATIQLSTASAIDPTINNNNNKYHINAILNNHTNDDTSNRTRYDITHNAGIDNGITLIASNFHATIITTSLPVLTQI